VSRRVLERIAITGEFDENPGCGVAFQVDVEDTIGLKSQIEAIFEDVEDEL